jgi:uncharacterized cofD-like protein
LIGAKPKIVALGGGHGLAVTLQAARDVGGDITAVVSVADNGGSSGRLRATFDMPAPGDLRRCLVALAPPDSVWAKAFDHRFDVGELEGHAFGNLVIAGLAEATGDFGVAIDEAARLLGIDGRVLPATSVPVVLKAWVSGREVVGQMQVAGADGPIEGVSIVPPDAPAPSEVLTAIAEADVVVLGPGSLFTSVLATCVVPGIAQALAERPDGRVYVCNLGPEDHETDDFSAGDHLAVLAAHRVPVDVMVHDPANMVLGGPIDPAVTVVTRRLALPDGVGHDPQLLGAVLREFL